MTHPRKISLSKLLCKSSYLLLNKSHSVEENIIYLDGTFDRTPFCPILTRIQMWTQRAIHLPERKLCVQIRYKVWCDLGGEQKDGILNSSV
mgnify:CR=1 FL=1